VDGRVEDGHLLFDRNGSGAVLLEHLNDALALCQTGLGVGVQVGAELREGLQLTVLRINQLQSTGDLLHGLDLGVAADTGDRDAGVDGRHDARVEQLRLKEDLAVGDGDDVRGDVGGHIARLRLDDRQCRQAAAAQLVGELGRAFQQTGVQIEDVAGVSLTSRRTADQQRQGAVSDSVLGQVVVDDKDVLALVHEVFAHGTAGVGSDILQGRQLGCRCRHHDGVAHGTGLGEALHEVCHGRALLADSDVDADDVLALLVDDGIGRDGGLAGLAVADDELTLAAADGDHGVDGLDAGLQRLLDGLALDDAGSRALDGAELRRLDGACAVDGLAQCVDDTADQCLAHRDGHDLAGALDSAALFDSDVGAQQNDGDGVLLEVLGHAVLAVLKLEQLACHALFQTAGAGDAVAHQNDRADLALLDDIFVMLDLSTDDLGDLFRFQLHCCVFTTQFFVNFRVDSPLRHFGPALPSRLAAPRAAGLRVYPRASYSLQCCCCDAAAQAGEAAADGAVQLGAFDVQPDAAQHSRLDLRFEVDVPAGDFFQLFVQAPDLLCRERHSGNSSRFQNAVSLIVAQAVSPGAARQLPQSAFFAQQFHKVEHIEVDLPAEGFVQQRTALFLGDAGDAEQMQILGVPVQQGGHAIQFAQNALVQPFLRGQVVQASAVHPCSLGHDASPTFLINSSIRS